MVLGRAGMVCTSQSLASFAGAELLRSGANAIDAAICAAAVLGVVEPFSTGVGGDCFMLIWHAADQTLYGLNGSGRAPTAASAEHFAARGIREMPSHGMLPVTVPGAVEAWCTAAERFGSRSLVDLLAPATHYASDGFPVTEIIARHWADAISQLPHLERIRPFTLDGRAPRLGEIVRLPGLARSLEMIAHGGSDVFYRGELAQQIVDTSETHGGLLTRADLAAHRSEWVTPISTEYRGYQVSEIPPNGQGLTALLALNILECFDLSTLGIRSAAAIHLRIEAIKLAFADRNRYLADPALTAVPTEQLLSKNYAQGRAALIHPSKAQKSIAPGSIPVGSDTVYLATADKAGNVVSLINSLFFPFGSGTVVGDTGIVLQNRGFGFSLDPNHPNCIAPGKRPLHTIIPAMMFKDGRPLLSFGVMGGDMQPQGHLQVVSNLVDYGCNIQEAIDRPRFRYCGTDRVALETALGHDVGEELARMGHAIEDANAMPGGFGGAQGIKIHPDTGTYWGASDSRKDGCAIGF